MGEWEGMVYACCTVYTDDEGTTDTHTHTQHTGCHSYVYFAANEWLKK